MNDYVMNDTLSSTKNVFLSYACNEQSLDFGYANLQ